MKMLHNFKNSCLFNGKLMAYIRCMTTTEVSTALRPFYFNVHPDLFGQYPSERKINENNLKILNQLIEALQIRKSIKPASLQFYLRDKNRKDGKFRLVKIYLDERDIRMAIIKILKSCDLSTDYVDKIPKLPPTQPPHNPSEPPLKYKKTNHPNMDFAGNDPIFAAIFKEKINKAKDAFNLQNWLAKNYKNAIERLTANEPLREEVTKLKGCIRKELNLKEIRWECGWNITHFRGCLQSFMSLANQHPENMYILKNRILVFAPFTGISLDGHIMLNSGEVRHNWLDLIKNVQKYDSSLLRIPSFEKALSQVLRGIKVGRRKFMPKILAGEYERNLQQITTSLNDYRGTRDFPKQWPTSLNNYEIVVETEAGPLMVSPTGQFIVPSSLPGFLLINFITNNLKEAHDKGIIYEQNKHVERSLHKKCIDEFNLYGLIKDDNVTPDLMIKCCENLLNKKDVLKQYLNGIHLNIATYYSVLSDGVVCIPWNWKI